jgi:23S rRNA (uracil1939-C5)-methyltransferase
MPARKAVSDFEVRIDKIVYGGDGLGRAQGKVVFVPFSVPGDLLRVRPVEQKKNYIRAQVLTVIEPGPGRRQPHCPYFGSCGGCQWQQLEYVRQVETKRKILEETLNHHFPETRKLLIPMTASPVEYHYRSRARVQVRAGTPAAAVGFFRFRSHDVEDIQMCPLLRPTLNEALAALREQARTSVPPAPEIDISCSEEQLAWSSLPTGSPGAEYSAESPTVGLLRRVVGTFAFSINPGVFFQANDFAVEDLSRSVRDFAQGRGNGAALDLYSGVGLFSLPLATQYHTVTAVESSPAASALCAANAAAAGLTGVRTVCADAGRWMAAVGSVSSPGFELIVLDPPRTGTGVEVMQRIRDWAPETVIYVSCDPQTMCRDLAVLPARDYRIDEVLGIDLFPQTYHFETVARIVRR